MLLETGAQIVPARLPSGGSRRDRDIDRRQGVLVQAKGLSCKAFDAIARDRGAEGSRRNTQTQASVGFMIGQNRQTKKCIGKFFAALLDFAKFGRLMQALARLERQPLDGNGDRSSVQKCVSGTEALAPFGATAGEQGAAALGGHAGAKAVGTGTM
jgi:hypothetical protein